MCGLFYVYILLSSCIFFTILLLHYLSFLPSLSLLCLYSPLAKFTVFLSPFPSLNFSFLLPSRVLLFSCIISSLLSPHLHIIRLIFPLHFPTSHFSSHLPRPLSFCPPLIPANSFFPPLQRYPSHTFPFDVIPVCQKATRPERERERH